MSVPTPAQIARMSLREVSQALDVVRALHYGGSITPQELLRLDQAIGLLQRRRAALYEPSAVARRTLDAKRELGLTGGRRTIT
jgi:hypothetical protein